MTADAMKGVKEDCLEAGMMDFVTKPIDPSEVFSLLVKWIKPKENIQLTNDKNIELEQNSEIDIPELDYINTKDGLRRVANNKKLYKKLLTYFKTNYNGFIQKFNELINNDKISDATIQIHTLKGVAGNIGALNLAKSAEAIEIILKNQEFSKYEFLILDLEVNLVNVITALQKIESQNDTFTKDDNSEKISKELLMTYLEEIIKLLKDDDFDASAKTNELINQKGISQYKFELNKIYAKIQKYDFEESLELSLNLYEKIKTEDE